MIEIALIICTYNRGEDVNRNVQCLKDSLFFDPFSDKYGRLHIFVVDNASNLKLETGTYVHLIYNRNTGGSGGFQRGIEEVRASDIEFTHVVFMDDDVRFEASSFYILYDALCNMDPAYIDHPVAGRMFDIDNPNIQWTAAEMWNGGNIAHIEGFRDITQLPAYTPGRVVYDTLADYGGWWCCCYPYSFVRDNDIMPFFLHCDDVEYGLRCGKAPIIIEGFQVWHETWEKKFSKAVAYYDMRNTLFVNDMYGYLPSPKILLQNWKDAITKYHVEHNWDYEYVLIKAMDDFLNGMNWLRIINPEKYHRKIQSAKSNKIKNAFYWRFVEKRFKKKFGLY